MRCVACYTINEPGAEACTSCGATLSTYCATCAAENSVGARFCSQCAAPLAAISLLAASGERRQLTVLFCDLVGSVATSRMLDPEDWRDVVRAYHSACGKVVRSFYGHIAQFLGDGLLVYFGYPVAAEDSPRRAVQAGLALIEAVESVGATLNIQNAVALQARIGVHTGPAVVANMGERQESLALGDTPNLAARIQAEAEAGTVFVSEATFRLTRGFFSFSNLGPRSLKGIPDPLPLYRVEAESGATTRIEAAIRTGLTPFVGHEKERALLAQRWKQTTDGKGHVVLLTGEPGIGKSRHVDLLRAGLQKETTKLVEFRCSPHHQGSPLYPLIDLLEHRIKLTRDLSDREKQARLIDELGDGDKNHLKLLATLLRLTLTSEYQPVDLPAQARRPATFDALLSWLRRVIAGTPTLLVVEDLHWADPSTLEFLELLVAAPGFDGCLIVLTARPEFRPAWSRDSRVETITIDRLDQEQMRSLVSYVGGSRSLPRDVVDHLLDKGDGVPLFLEEMTKSVIESGNLRVLKDRFELVGDISPGVTPSTLQDSLMARFDHLRASKVVLQLASALGREFSYDLLQAVSSAPDESLRIDLRRLVDAELIFQEDDRGSYIFKHALIQEAAYQSLLRSTRQEYHQRIAITLRDRFAELSASQPEWLAHHFAAGGQSREAIGYFQMAGERAIAASAFPEAIGHFSRGLEMLSAVPTDERARCEIGLRSGIGVAYLTTRGFSSKEVEETYTRAAALCDELIETPVGVLYGIWAVHFVRSDLEATVKMVSRFQRLAQGEDNSGPKLVAYSCVATWAFWRGDYDLSMKQAILAHELCNVDDPKKQHEEFVPKFGLDCPLYGLYYIAWCHLIRGEPGQARRHFDTALRLAEEIADPYVLAVTLAYGGAMSHDVGDHKRTAELADRSRQLASEKGFPFWLAATMVQSGFATAKMGDPTTGIQRMNDGLGIFKMIGSKAAFPYYSSYLADILIEVGKLDDAEAILSEGRLMMQTNLDRNYEPELLRLQGKALSKRRRFSEADAAFRQAMAIAQGHNAKLLELRTAISLAESGIERSDGRMSFEPLGALYRNFSEDLDVPLLREAERLLESA